MIRKRTEQNTIEISATFLSQNYTDRLCERNEQKIPTFSSILFAEKVGIFCPFRLFPRKESIRKKIKWSRIESQIDQHLPQLQNSRQMHQITLTVS